MSGLGKSMQTMIALAVSTPELRTMVSNVLGELKCGCRQKIEWGKDSYVFIVHDFRHDVFGRLGPLVFEIYDPHA